MHPLLKFFFFFFCFNLFLDISCARQKSVHIEKEAIVAMHDLCEETLALRNLIVKKDLLIGLTEIADGFLDNGLIDESFHKDINAFTKDIKQVTDFFQGMIDSTEVKLKLKRCAKDVIAEATEESSSEESDESSDETEFEEPPKKPILGTIEELKSFLKETQKLHELYGFRQTIKDVYGFLEANNNYPEENKPDEELHSFRRANKDFFEENKNETKLKKSPRKLIPGSTKQQDDFYKDVKRFFKAIYTLIDPNVIEYAFSITKEMGEMKGFFEELYKMNQINTTLTSFEDLNKINRFRKVIAATKDFLKELEIEYKKSKRKN